MATPEFWSSEVALYSEISPDDGDYRWVLRGHEWIPAKTQQGKLAGHFVATTVTGEKFDCQSTDLGENIPSVNELKRLPDDLIHLDDMSEKSVVHALTQRFARDNIYTSIGDILIAINPFRPLPLYTPTVLQQYLSPYSQNLPPHPYEISRRAYRSMLQNRQDQAILISGESGAGKTETTKLCLSFFSEAAGSSTGIEQKILSANPILEAFGNAKTIRNHNSSRFGKFMNLSFEVDSGIIVGCGTTNYLLEKSRVHKQASGERSYHIFYQICGAVADSLLNPLNESDARVSYRRKTLYDADSDSRRSLRGDLGPLSLTGKPEDYHYLVQSGCIAIPNVSDFDQFSAMENACIKLGLQKSEINDMYSVCAAILHLGNIQFEDRSDTVSGGCELNSSPKSLEALHNAAKLMGLSADEISLRLRTRELVLRGEVNSIQNTAAQSVEARDALSKMLYKRCFDWLVERTNLAMIDQQSGNEVNNKNGRRHIGILDIFGFEIFDVNGFEQFCINYANEKLQQHFNQHTFKSEIEACQRENISLEGFSFSDNQHVLDLIEAKSASSILSILDDECRVPKSTGLTFLNKLKEKHSKNATFSIAKGEASKDSFGIDHYAGRVIYKVNEFLEKNKDYLGEDLEGLLKRSYLSFEPPKTIEQLRQEEEEQLALGTGKAKPKQLTLGSKFRLQLDDLINKLNSSRPHFIRCVKPNEKKLCNFFHGVCVHQQLKQSGAFDALAIRKRGYNYQFKHEVFMSRYGPILRERYKNGEISQEFIETLTHSSKELTETETKKLCEEMIKLVATLPNMEQIALNIQVGSTMVFWRANEEKQLSSLRSREIQNQVALIQKRVRGMITRKYINNWLGIIKNEIMKEYHTIKQKRLGDGQDSPSESIELIDDDILILKSSIDKLYTIPLKLTYYLNLIDDLIKFLEQRKKLLVELKRLTPKLDNGENITKAWIQCLQSILKEDIRNCSLIQESQRLYHEYVGNDEGLHNYFKVLDIISLYDPDPDDMQLSIDNGEELTLASLQQMIGTISKFQVTIPKYCANEIARLKEMSVILEAEATLMNELISLYGPSSSAAPLPQIDCITKAVSLVSDTPPLKSSRKAKAALRMADYMLELRKQMVDILKLSDTLDMTSPQMKKVREPMTILENASDDVVPSALPPPPNRSSIVPRISQIYSIDQNESRKSVISENPMHRASQRGSLLHRRSTVHKKIDVLTKEMKRMNSRQIIHTRLAVHDILDDNWLNSLQNYLKDYQPLRDYVLKVTSLLPIVQLCDREIQSYKSCLDTLKSILKNTYAVLKHNCHDVMMCQNTLELIDSFNTNAPSDIPYLFHGAVPNDVTDITSELPAENSSTKLNLSDTRLFLSYRGLIEIKLLELKKEERLISELLATLQDTSVGLSSGTDGTFDLQEINIHGLKKLDEAIGHLKSAQISSRATPEENSFAQPTGYYLPSTIPIIQMSECILDIRKKLLEIKSLSTEVTTSEENSSWDELKNWMTKLSPFSGYYPPSLLEEIDFLRNVIYHHEHTKQEFEKYSNLEGSLKEALQNEDEGQLKFIFKQFDELATLKTLSASIADGADYDSIYQQILQHSCSTPLEQMEQSISLLICRGKQLCYRFATLRRIFHDYDSLQEYRIVHLNSLLNEIKNLQIHSIQRFNTYKSMEAKLTDLMALKHRVHEAWYLNYVNVEEMISLSKECKSRNFCDDDVAYMDFLLSKYYQDYSDYLKELIKLNQFLSRQGIVTELNVLLNDCYLTQQDEKNSTKDEDSVAEIIPTIQPKLSPKSPLSRSSVASSLRSSVDSSRNLINRASHDAFEPSDNKKPGFIITGQATGINASNVLSSLSVKERLKNRESSEEKKKIQAQNEHLQQQKAKAIAALIPSVQVQTIRPSEAEYEVIDLTAADHEGDLYVWHRYKGLRRFADPALEQARKVFSTNPIPNSLTRINHENYIQLAITSFKCLQGVMGDRVALYPSMLRNEFFTIAKTNIILADELYCQIMKQLTNNPSKVSREKGIEIFQHMIDITLPSQALRPYLEYFLREYQEVNLLLYLQSKYIKNNTSLLSSEMSDPLGAHQHMISTNNYSGYLYEMKGKLIQIQIKRWCMLDNESFSIYLCDDTTNRVAGYTMSQIKEIRSKSSQDNFHKHKYPFEIELKTGQIKILIADSIEIRARWIQAFKTAKFGDWNSKPLGAK